LKNGYEDPKFRWIEERAEEAPDRMPPRKDNYQVAGYITLFDGLNGILSNPFLDEDRWGDHEGQ
jgi:hypothetical protein